MNVKGKTLFISIAISLLVGAIGGWAISQPANAQATISELESRIRNAEGRVAVSQAAITAIGSQLATSNELNLRATREIERLRVEVASYRAEIIGYRKTLDSIKSAIGSGLTAIAGSITGIVEAENRIDRVISIIDEIAKRVGAY